MEASPRFYETLRFSGVAGGASQHWLILTSGACVLGLCQGMFEQNILTFTSGWDTPGWDRNAQPLSEFSDVRALQRQRTARGVPLQQEADERTRGPASVVAVDPDGNPILVDPHV